MQSNQPKTMSSNTITPVLWRTLKHPNLMVASLSESVFTMDSVQSSK